MKDYLGKFNHAAAECVYITPEDKLKYSVECLHPEITRFVYVCGLTNVTAAMRIATFIWADVENDKIRRGDSSGTKKDNVTRPAYYQPRNSTKQDTGAGYGHGNTFHSTEPCGNLLLTVGGLPPHGGGEGSCLKMGLNQEPRSRATDSR